VSGTVLVIPCFNEERRLPIGEFERFLVERDVELLFVDDGSTDGTAAVLAGLAESHPDRARVIGLGRRGGKAEAVRRGVQAARAAGAGYVGYWDADLATPLDAVLGLREVLEGASELQLVMGSRVQLLGRRIERSALRHYLGRIFATAVSISLGLAVYDTQCGAKLFRATPDLDEVFREPFLSGWAFDVEILARLGAIAEREGRPPLAETVVEYPLEQWVDVPGSKRRPRAYLEAAWDVARIHWAYRRRR
jgi:dolichyl-phosphate beta-glucosyltransferase